jgi:hypothetical protein
MAIERPSRRKQDRARKSPQEFRVGSPAALLDASRRCAQVVEPGDVEDLERLIAEGCERTEEAEKVFA